MCLLLSEHNHTAVELALETDDLKSFSLLLLCFAYYFMISSHDNFSRRRHKFRDFCCSVTMYLKREKYAQIMQIQMLKLLAFFLHYYFTEFSFNLNIFSSSPDFSNYFFHFYSCFYNDFKPSNIMPLSWLCFSFSWY